jgi:hypothetical protein
MSAFVARESSLPRHLAVEGVVAVLGFTVGELRTFGQTVSRLEWPEWPGHVAVRGRRPKSVKRAIIREATCVHPPDHECKPR